MASKPKTKPVLPKTAPKSPTKPAVPKPKSNGAKVKHPLLPLLNNPLAEVEPYTLIRSNFTVLPPLQVRPYYNYKEPHFPLKTLQNNKH